MESQSSAPSRKRKYASRSKKRDTLAKHAIECPIHGTSSPAWKNGLCKRCKNVQCKNHGKTSADGNGNCLICSKERSSKRYTAQKIANNGSTGPVLTTSACIRHPTCFMRMATTGACYLCTKANISLQGARWHVSTSAKITEPVSITVNHIRKLEETPCGLCGATVSYSIESNLPTTFSLGRIDHNVTYTPSNTRAEHLQCNKFRGDTSIAEAKTRLYALYNLHVVGNGILSGVVLPDPKYPAGTHESAGNRDVFSYLAKSKRNYITTSTGIAAPFLTRDFVAKLYHSQFGKCYICGLLLELDISFDQVIPNSGYDKEVKLAHRACNSGKGEWPLSTLIETAKTLMRKK